MTIESHLSADEMSEISEKVPRWFVSKKPICSINALRGTVEGVTLEVSHSNYGLGHVTGDRYTISAKINDTNLGEHQYVQEVVDGTRHEDPKGEEIVKTTFERICSEYHNNNKKFEKADIAHAKSLVS